MTSNKNKKIIVTGGSGRFGKVLRKKFPHFLYPSKKELNITKISSIQKFFEIKKPKVIIHLAGLSRPIDQHEKNINESIKLNIIGTSNIVMVCKNFNTKIIYFSTSYVYPGKKGNYKETDPILPSNNYAWSKLGGECAVQMYKKSLILRVCMTERPFVHKKAFTDVKLNFIFHDQICDFLKKIINKTGILNLGGPTKTVYNFAKQYNLKVKKISIKGLKNVKFPKNASMNINKLKNILVS
jgi:dTDP-4-dehydrorhamnose reductase